MTGVNQHAVDQHKCGLKNIEEPLVADNRALCARVEARIEEIDGLDLKVFHSSVDGSYEDECCADVESE